MTWKMISCRMKQLLFQKMKGSGPSSEIKNLKTMTLGRYSARTKRRKPVLNPPVNGQRPRQRRRKGNEGRRGKSGKKRNVPLQPHSEDNLSLCSLRGPFFQQKRKLDETTESGDLTSVALRSPSMISEYLSTMQARSFSKMSALELQDRHIPGTCSLATLSEDFS